jgi:hypothetical protein
VRTIRAVLPAGLFLFCVGCPGGPSQIDLPAEIQVLGERAATRDGRTSLVVVTGTFLDLNLSDDTGTLTRHTGYTIYDDRGEKLEYVRNFVGTLDTVPTAVELDPGSYLILPDTPGRLPDVFRVVLEAGKRTTVEAPR